MVAEELAKGTLDVDTKKSWCFAIHGWNRNDLNRDFLKKHKKKIWVNTSKNKEDRETSPLNECMDVQNQGFRAHLLPKEEVPVYLQSQGNFKPMLRFSMRVYTRKETSANTVEPTRVVVLSLQRPSRKVCNASSCLDEASRAKRKASKAKKSTQSKC